MVSASAPGKMILIGEYAVLEGAPALVYAINRKAHVVLAERTLSESLVEAPSLGIEAQPFVITPSGHVRFDPNAETSIQQRLEFFRLVYESLGNSFRQKQITLPPLHLSLRTDDFYSSRLKTKLGFGSSAALTVALVRGLMQITSSGQDTIEIFNMARKAHHYAQDSTGSGIDIASSTFGGIIRYTLPADPAKDDRFAERIPEWPELCMRVVWTGRSVSTKKLVKGVKQLNQQNPKLYGSLMDSLTEISRSGCKAFIEREMNLFLEAVNDFFQVQIELGRKSGMPIISESHQQLAELAAKLGLVYKPSGAGSGDIGIAFGNDPGIADQFALQAQKAGFQIIEVQAAERQNE